MEFTGDYYKCKYCGYIWDYMDVCPNCGEDKMNTLNAHEIKEEANRLLKMLEAHGDDIPNKEKEALPLQSVTNRALQMKIEKLEAENKLLAFMFENGLGEEDMMNDITYPHEL
jgi:primosomal protein N'